LSKHNLANHIEVVRDGEEALEYLFCSGQHAGRRFDHPPRLVLLDLKLPKVDGIDVLRKVKGDPRTKAIPVVILTGSREEGDMVEGYKLGVNAYIQKPVDFDEFRKLWNNWDCFGWLPTNRRHRLHLKKSKE
jgi:CheY-like chemotaxis protein